MNARSILIPLCFAILFATGCGQSKEAEECAKSLAASQAANKELKSVLRGMEQELDEMRDTLRKKHQEVRLHRATPDVTDRKVVGLESENRQLREGLEELQDQYATLLRRYDAQQRRLMECQQENDPSP